MSCHPHAKDYLKYEEGPEKTNVKSEIDIKEEPLEVQNIENEVTSKKSVKSRAYLRLHYKCDHCDEDFYPKQKVKRLQCFKCKKGIKNVNFLVFMYRGRWFISILILPWNVTASRH